MKKPFHFTARRWAQRWNDDAVQGQPRPLIVRAATLDKIMRCTLRIGESTMMASDGRCDRPAEFKGFDCRSAPKNIADTERMFAALSEGGKVLMPLERPSGRPALAWLPTSSA